MIFLKWELNFKEFTVKYKRNDHISYNVDNKYDIVFNRCTPIVNGVKRKEEQLLMYYTKNGKTVNNAPAFNQMEMVKAIFKLYDSNLLSTNTIRFLREGIFQTRNAA